MDNRKLVHEEKTQLSNIEDFCSTQFKIKYTLKLKNGHITSHTKHKTKNGCKKTLNFDH